MLKHFKHFTRVLFATALLLLSQHAATAASYTVHDVYQAARAGELQEAQTMMQQVLRDHPESAKAHYVEAELYAKSGQYDDARRELKTAKRLDPTLGFARQDAVDSLQARLDAAPVTSSFRSKTGSHWSYWLLGIGLVAIIAMALRSLMRRNATPAATTFGTNLPQVGYGAGYGAGSGAGYAPTAPGGMGGGLLGGLATGAALGAGMVAGEAMASHFIDGGRNSERLSGERLDAASPANDWDDNMGGNDFGLNDNSSWDDSGGGDIGGDWS